MYCSNFKYESYSLVKGKIKYYFKKIGLKWDDKKSEVKYENGKSRPVLGVYNSEEGFVIFKFIEHEGKMCFKEKDLFDKTIEKFKSLGFEIIDENEIDNNNYIKEKPKPEKPKIEKKCIVNKNDFNILKEKLEILDEKLKGLEMFKFSEMEYDEYEELKSMGVFDIIFIPSAYVNDIFNYLLKGKLDKDFRHRYGIALYRFLLSDINYSDFAKDGLMKYYVIYSIERFKRCDILKKIESE